MLSKIVKAIAILPESLERTGDAAQCLHDNGVGIILNITDKRNEICVYKESIEKAERVLRENDYSFSVRDYDMFSKRC